MPELRLTEADDDKSFVVHPGDRVVIQIPENPTTGYRWTVEPPGKEIVELLDSTYSPAPDSATGSGGQRTVIFKTKAAGIAEIQLKLARVWETDKPALRSYRVTVDVQP